MDKIELLAPGGSKESIYAAVQGGADAIYMGGTKFSARAYASNFSEEELIEVVNYCHIYGVKVYIAFNTLIKEKELLEAIAYGKYLYTIGVDAVITQDMGLFKLLKEEVPDLEVHASTQMSIHNGEGALFLKNIGFQRIVLSRELNLNEIKYISKDLNIETEIFVHGALCISYSGQCLMSSIIGGRSGNRGRCAQPCRLPYSIIKKSTGESKEGYLLSPKDTCTIDEIEDLINSGTSSLKIEGRMKRPEYVSGVVTSYREAIDSVYNKKSFNVESKKTLLNQLFNREGFSKAYLKGNIGRDMMAYKFPKNTGVYLGRVNKDLTIKLLKDISVQDGVRTNEGGFIITNIIKGKDKVKEAFKGDIVKLMPAKYRAGDLIYVTLDNKLMTELQKNYIDIYKKKLPLTFNVSVEIGKPLFLSSVYDNKEFKVYGDIVEAAASKPMEKESFIKSISKLGDTPFELKEIVFDCFEYSSFLRAASINSARRQLIEKVLNYIKDKDKKSINNTSAKLIWEEENYNTNRFNDEYLITVKSEKQLEGAISFIDKELSFKPAIAVDLFQKGTSITLESIEYDNLYLVVPNIIKEEFDNIVTIVEKYISKVRGIITANLGIINKFKGRTSIVGDYKLNILNSKSYEFYNKFTDISSLSAELNSNEIFEISSKIKKPVQVNIYGKYELMVSEYCVIGSTFGTKSINSSCAYKCYNDSYVLKDRMNEEFLVKTDKFCRSHIYNPIPVNLVPYLKELKKNNINNYRIDFIDEGYEETYRVLNYIFKEPRGDIGRSTKGHYKRGIE